MWTPEQPFTPEQLKLFDICKEFEQFTDKMGERDKVTTKVQLELLLGRLEKQTRLAKESIQDL